MLLALRDSPVALRDLPGVLGTSKQAVSKLVNAMVAAGYVERDDRPGRRAGQAGAALGPRPAGCWPTVEEVYADLERGLGRPFSVRNGWPDSVRI